MKSAFGNWIGQPVILRLLSGDVRVPLRGTIVGESSDAVRFRIGDGWDVDIYKTMVLAVEEDRLMRAVNQVQKVGAEARPVKAASANALHLM